MTRSMLAPPVHLSMLRAVTTLVLGLGVASQALPAAACTALELNRQHSHLVAKSYDWDMEQGLVIINKRGIAKRALVLDPQERPAAWVSAHASVTFNQYGRELPCSGMNDAGLVIEALWLSASKFPKPDQRPALTELQWIQYQLDRYGSVADVRAHAQDVRVALAYGKVHYFVADRSGACAIVEHLNGRMVVTQGPALKVPALTNNTYADSLRYLAHQPASKVPLDMNQSLPRFARACRLATTKANRPQDPVHEAFAALDRVRDADTRWNIVYDPQRQTVWFRTASQPVVKSVRLAAFDPTSARPAQILDILTPTGGDVSAKFTDYTEAANLSLVKRSLKDIADHFPPGTAERLAHYPSLLQPASQAPDARHQQVH